MLFMTRWLRAVFKDITNMARSGDVSNNKTFAEMNAELHGISSGSKVFNH
jgi:hypothetical protein